ncbi:conserved hypothetical protein [Rubrivivax sp. A210]|uniref:DUF3024 domain-containing protein n=1 Tax=Rubrivivax sp. A210 TaxID=2772301 RepID=UPI001918EFBB|nr:hypothetical protein [Rubrivivax sp. A210]CAD5371939.1 conserved hypothetical protein [Rubrivivax sp. A210]
MNASGVRPRRRRGAPAGRVLALDALRIERALAARTRYRYVQPRVEAVGAGWQVHCPNCSRHIAPDGGEIAIAWFEPGPEGRWRLHARLHEQGLWELQEEGLTLPEALERVCADPLGVYWP